MNKAIGQHIHRRSLLKGSVAITATTALGSVPAIAAVRDPIFDLIAEADRLHALATEVSARRDAARESVGNDCSGCGWPPLDTTKPELAVMIPWLEQYTGYSAEDRAVSRKDIEQYNRGLVEAVERAGEALGGFNEKGEQMLARYRRDAEARLEWVDRRVAERERNAEVSGYRRLNDESEALWEHWCDANAAALEAEPITIEGALAQLAIVVRDIEEDIARDEDAVDNYQFATVRAYHVLVSLLGRSDVA